MDWLKMINNNGTINNVKKNVFSQNQFNFMDLAKKAENSNKKDTYEKEKKLTIGGLDFNDVLFVYEKNASNEGKVEREGNKVIKHIEEEWKAYKSDYAYLANENGEIKYNGVTFFYNAEEDIISLGDISNKDNVLNINLSGGTVLQVNRDNIDGLVKGIGMFKPEDIRRIMEAISIDSRSRNKPTEVEKEINDTYDEMLDKMQGKEEQKNIKEEKK